MSSPVVDQVVVVPTSGAPVPTRGAWVPRGVGTWEALSCLEIRARSPKSPPFRQGIRAPRGERRSRISDFSDFLPRVGGAVREVGTLGTCLSSHCLSKEILVPTGVGTRWGPWGPDLRRGRAQGADLDPRAFQNAEARRRDAVASAPGGGSAPTGARSGRPGLPGGGIGRRLGGGGRGPVPGSFDVVFESTRGPGSTRLRARSHPPAPRGEGPPC